LKARPDQFSAGSAVRGKNQKINGRLSNYENQANAASQLACFSCQLGDLNEASRWLERAFAVSGKAEIKIKALEERDLEPLWKKIGTL
jgi:hypothetical protein